MMILPKPIHTVNSIPIKIPAGCLTERAVELHIYMKKNSKNQNNEVKENCIWKTPTT